MTDLHERARLAYEMKLEEARVKQRQSDEDIASRRQERIDKSTPRLEETIQYVFGAVDVQTHWDDQEYPLCYIILTEFPGVKFYYRDASSLSNRHFLARKTLAVPENPEYEDWWNYSPNFNIKSDFEQRISTLADLGEMIHALTAFDAQVVTPRPPVVDPLTPRKNTTETPYAFLCLSQLNQDTRSLVILNSGLDDEGDPWIFVQYLGDSASVPF